MHKKLLPAPMRPAAAAIEREIQKLPRKIFCIAPGLGDAYDCWIEYRK
jgi:hypothetical protein